MTRLELGTRLPTLFGRTDGGLIEDLLRRMGRMPVPSVSEALWEPSVELLEGADEYVFTAELPGVKQEDVEVDVHGGYLTVKGEKKEETEKKEKRYHVWERCYGEFERTIALPPSVAGEKIRAEFKDGVLTVRLPKTKEAQGRKIEIEAHD